MALPKKYRLSFREKKILGKAHDGPFFKLVFIKNDYSKRFAFVVSNRISKKAVERNKIKRYLGEGIRELAININNGDYVFYAKNEIIKKNAKEIKEELERFLIKKDFLINEKTSTVFD